MSEMTGPTPIFAIATIGIRSLCLRYLVQIRAAAHRTESPNAKCFAWALAAYGITGH